MLLISDRWIARGQAPTRNNLHGASAAAGVARERPQFAVIQVTRRIFAAGHDACIEHAPGEHTMNTRTRIAMTSLAVLWITTGLAFGGLSILSAAPPLQATTLPAWLCAPPSAHGAIECGRRP
jgi:hypothetical protein